MSDNNSMKLIAVITLPVEAKNPNNAYYTGRVGKTGRAITFMKPDYKQYKADWVEEAKKIMQGCQPIKGAIFVKSFWTFGTRRKKDVQNCGKLELDALNNIVYEDDSQIVMEEKFKIYSKNNPSVVLEIYSVENYEDWEF